MPHVLIRIAIHLTSIFLTVTQVKLSLPRLLLKIDALAFLAQEMIAAQATNALTHLAYHLSKQNQAAIPLMLMKTLMKIPKRQLLVHLTIDAIRFHANLVRLANQENASMEPVSLKTKLSPRVMQVLRTGSSVIQR